MWYLVVTALLASAYAVPAPKTFRLCVPHGVYEACLQMVEQGKGVGVSISCVPARDRLDCLQKLKDHEADWEAVDPEDMYVAARKFGDNFQVFKEIRTKEEPDAEFRYEAVVVIHKDFDIKSVEDLRGHKSCHTGVGRNVGYKIPITKLGKMGVLPSINDTKLSPRENELKALSSFFSKSCIVGKWSPDPETNRRLKEQYSNLCQLCEFPDKCDYPDQNSGYEGALRCLAVGGGDVAFTKVIFVKKFFGMEYGSQPATPSQYNPEDFLYFCPDASKRPIKGEPCIWAARPWPGYMTAEQEQDQIAILREDITKLNNLGESSHAEWITSVLAMNNKTLARDNKGPFKPYEYLEKAKYVDVIERGALDPRIVRICSSSPLELQKCQDLVSGAYSRDIRPVMTCVSKESLEECLTAVRDSEADVVSLDAGLAANAISKFSLEPVLIEEYEDDHKVTSVAVIKKTSSFQKWADLKGHKACMSNIGEAAGWVMPLQTLIEKGLIDKNNCPYYKALGEFFTAGTKYSEDPLQCLSDEEGDVAFIDYYTAKKHIDAGNTDSSNFELLCKEEGRKPFDQYASCNLGTVPPRLVLGRKALSAVDKDDINFALMSAADLYHKHPEYFLMFGSYDTKQDILFSNAASGLDSVHGSSSLRDFSKIQEELKICTPEESKP